MKKTYIKPAIETLHISTQHVIAVSFSGDTGTGDLNDDYAHEVLSLDEKNPFSFILGQ